MGSITTVIGIVGLSGAIMGYYVKHTTVFERIPLFVGAVLLIIPEKITDLIGLSILVGLFFLQKYRRPVKQRQF